MDIDRGTVQLGELLPKLLLVEVVDGRLDGQLRGCYDLCDVLADHPHPLLHFYRQTSTRLIYIIMGCSRTSNPSGNREGEEVIICIACCMQATTMIDLKPEEGHAIGSELPVGAQNLTGTCSHAVLLVERLALLKVPHASKGQSERAS